MGNILLSMRGLWHELLGQDLLMIFWNLLLFFPLSKKKKRLQIPFCVTTIYFLNFFWEQHTIEWSNKKTKNKENMYNLLLRPAASALLRNDGRIRSTFCCACARTLWPELLGQGALGCEFHLQNPAQVLALKLGILPHVGGNHSLDLPALQQLTQSHVRQTWRKAETLWF